MLPLSVGSLLFSSLCVASRTMCGCWHCTSRFLVIDPLPKPPTFETLSNYLPDKDSEGGIYNPRAGAFVYPARNLNTHCYGDDCYCRAKVSSGHGSYKLNDAAYTKAEERRKKRAARKAENIQRTREGLRK